MNFDYYRKKFLAWEWSADQKPKKKDRRYLRRSAKQKERREIDEHLEEIQMSEKWFVDELLNEEANEAMDCYKFGPYERCLESSGGDDTNSDNGSE